MSQLKKVLRESLRPRRRARESGPFSVIRANGMTYGGVTPVMSGAGLNFRDLKKRDGSYPTWQELQALFGSKLVGNERSYTDPGYVTIRS